MLLPYRETHLTHYSQLFLAENEISKHSKHHTIKQTELIDKMFIRCQRAEVFILTTSL